MARVWAAAPQGEKKKRLLQSLGFVCNFVQLRYERTHADRRGPLLKRSL